MIKWEEINASTQKQGKPLPVMDLLIASTCLAKDLTLITRNEKDFYNTKVMIINPFG